MADTCPPRPTTQIPELLAMRLSDQEFKAVVAAIEAADAVQVKMLNSTGGASVRWRIEMAAAFLAAAIGHGRDASVSTSVLDPAVGIELVIDLVTRRAREIWGQGGV